jgi:hypothetical protein
MNKVSKSLVLSLLVAILFVTGCAQAVPATPLPQIQVMHAGGIGDGNVISLGLVQTLQYISLVMRGDPFTGVLKDPAGDNFLLYWTMNSNVGFLGITAKGTVPDILKKVCGSNCSNPFTFTDLYNYLKTQGWNEVAPVALPPWMVTTFGSVTAFMTTYGNIVAMPLIIIVPGGNFANPNHAGNS